MSLNKKHFLVVAGASRGARLFIKKALQEGHDVTAICRAESESAALVRMNTLLLETTLTANPLCNSLAKEPMQLGILRATNRSILSAETYITLLQNDLSINAVCCFVGVTKLADMLNKQNKLYSQTIKAIIRGMQNSRLVEFYYHGSSGTEGVPGHSFAKLPDNYRLKWLLNMINYMPIVKDYRESEGLLAEAADNGMQFVIFRPAFLTKGPAKRRYHYCFDTTGFDNQMLPLKHSTMDISREDVAEAILRVALMPATERQHWFGHGVYLANMKASFYN
ncbi:MAG: NAD(P)H-binding protein [Gammaproteobacteria bacterium]|jgi:putative NADH-flavin reductase|nr:NAD(P)H-binding protein [Gammaproteobacteria bacterium]